MFDYRELRAACFRLISDFDHSWFAACMVSSACSNMYASVGGSQEGR